MAGCTTVDDLFTPHTQRASEAKSTMGNDAVEDLIEDDPIPERAVTPKPAKCTPKRQR